MLSLQAARGTIPLASVENNLATIQNAIYGKDMRQSIYESIKTLYESINSLKADFDTFSGTDAKTSRIYASRYIKMAITAMYPEYTVIQRTVLPNTSDSLIGDNPYYLIESASFSPERDGLLIWRNGDELVSPAFYGFDTESVSNYVKISFHRSGYFQSSDTVQFVVYKKPTSGAVVTVEVVRRSGGELLDFEYGLDRGDVGGILSRVEDDDDEDDGSIDPIVTG